MKAGFLIKTLVQPKEDGEPNQSFHQKKQETYQPYSFQPKFCFVHLTNLGF